MSCNNEPKYTAEEWEAKQEENKEIYNITTYTLSTKGKALIGVFLEATEEIIYHSKEDLLEDIINYNLDFKNFDDNVRKELKQTTYKASEIISYTNTDVRFIDYNTDREKFISADYIKID